MTQQTLLSFSAMLKGALEGKIRPEARDFLEMLAEDAVMEFPYAPAGTVGQLKGRAAVAAHLTGLGKILDLHGVTTPKIHRTTEHEVLILEFEGFGKGTATGKAYEQSYISVITLDQGYIVSYRDYWNPLVVLNALGDPATVAAALATGASQ